MFHESSYGYRAGRNAHQALKSAEENCWRKGWVIDLDIKGFFDNIEHEKLLKGLAKHFDEKWVLMYVSRWLSAEVEHPDGSREKRESGTPQGGVISPLLSNVYLHYTFDAWMDKTHGLKFERYADDIIVHCTSEGEALTVLESIRARMLECGLELHGEKTKIVYCGKGIVKGRDGYYPRKFKFLGYEFKPSRRYSRQQRRGFTKIKPRASSQAKQDMMAEFKQVIKKGGHGGLTLWAERLNAKIRGWLNYYSHFDRLELSGVMRHLNWRLAEWGRKSLKRFKRSKKRAWVWLKEQCRENPRLFAHWEWGLTP